ncbi:MAG: GNAT family N-acetyltransferase, partial [Flavobacteriales bacterium]|nr:GNAT family N-acetyltransferase [Flavobacteriales bacterium]
SDPRVHTYLGNKPVKSKKESEDIINRLLTQYEIYGTARLAMIEKATGEFMGWGGLKFEQNLREEFDYYDLGYRLRPKFWGKGHATASAIASANYGFEVMGLDKIGAAADVDHDASNAILKKIGMANTEQFTFEDGLCNWYWLTREQWDSSDLS